MKVKRNGQTTNHQGHNTTTQIIDPNIEYAVGILPIFLFIHGLRIYSQRIFTTVNTNNRIKASVHHINKAKGITTKPGQINGINANKAITTAQNQGSGSHNILKVNQRIIPCTIQLTPKAKTETLTTLVKFVQRVDKNFFGSIESFLKKLSILSKLAKTKNINTNIRTTCNTKRNVLPMKSTD